MSDRGIWTLVVVLWGAALPLALAEEDPDTEIARRHFDEGSRFYAEKSYSQALAEFQAAREMRPLPELDFNIARCLDRMERFEEAVEVYERYLAAKPEAVDAGEVKGRIVALKARLVEREAAKRAGAPPEEPVPSPAPAPVAPTAPPESPGGKAPGARPLLGPVLLGGGALVVAVIGTAIVGSVVPDLDRLKRNGCVRPCGAVEELKLRANVGYAMWGIAALAGAVDVVLWIAQLRGRPTEESARVIVGPQGIAVAGVF